MVEFHVLRCAECQTFQVLQVTKAAKWTCKMCGLKQSTQKVYGRGTGADCRKHVQKLNSIRHEISWTTEEQHLFSASQDHVQQNVSHQGKFDPDQSSDSSSSKSAASSCWSCFMETPDDLPPPLNMSSTINDTTPEIDVHVFTDWDEYQETRKARRQYRYEMSDGFSSPRHHKFRKISEKQENSDAFGMRESGVTSHASRISRPGKTVYNRPASGNYNHSKNCFPESSILHSTENLSSTRVGHYHDARSFHMSADNMYPSSQDEAQLCQAGKVPPQIYSEHIRKVASRPTVASKWSAFLEVETQDDDDDDATTLCGSSQLVTTLNSSHHSTAVACLNQVELLADTVSMYSYRKVDKKDPLVTKTQSCKDSQFQQGGLFDLGFNLDENELHL